VRVGARCVATSFGRVQIRVLGAGTYTVKLKPNAAARRALSRGRTLAVVETITFRPSDGSKTVTKFVRVTVRPPKHKKRG
jgi:VCBS repeat-containing protein